MENADPQSAELARRARFPALGRIVGGLAVLGLPFDRLKVPSWSREKPSVAGGMRTLPFAMPLPEF